MKEVHLSTDFFCFWYFQPRKKGANEANWVKPDVEQRTELIKKNLKYMDGFKIIVLLLDLNDF